MTQPELLRLHISALYVLDREGRLVCGNELHSPPAPLLYVGKTPEGQLACHTHRDLEGEACDRIAVLAQNSVSDPMAYRSAIGAGRIVEELAYLVPRLPTSDGNCTLLSPEQAGRVRFGAFSWLARDLLREQPCCVYLEQGEVVAVCRSVRLSKAHEAGIETHPAHRGRGLAQQVLAGWSEVVIGRGSIPLYSTLKTNTASRRVAEKAGLQLFAEGFHIDAE